MTNASASQPGQKATCGVLNHYRSSYVTANTDTDALIVTRRPVQAAAIVKDSKPHAAPKHDDGAANPASPRPQLTTQQQQAAASGLQHQLASTEDLLGQMKARAFARSQELRQQRRQRDYSQAKVPRPQPACSDTAVGLRPQQQQRRHRQQATIKPEIAQAIAVLDSTASDIKTTFDELYHRDRVVLDAVEARALHCGTAASCTGSRVEVCQDRLEYQFHHVHEGKVHMIMRYRDMQRCELDQRARSLTFQVPRPLRHFTSDYSPSGQWGRGQAGCLVVGLTTQEDTDRLASVLKKLVPKLVFR